MVKKLAILCVPVLFVLVVGWAIIPVQAHCSGDETHNAKHKTDPCVPDVGGSGGLVVFDDNGTKVGTILDIFQGQNPSILLIVKIQSRNVLMRVDPDQIGLSGTVQFEGPNCTGNSWVNPDFFGSFQSSTLAFTRIVLADQNAPEGSRRELWDDVEPTDILAFSQLAGTCNNFPGGLLRENLVPATKLEDDLHTIFPPPYRLELQ